MKIEMKERCTSMLNQSEVVTINALRSNSDKRQIFLCNMNAFSVGEVMRIKDMITTREFRW